MEFLSWVLSFLLFLSFFCCSESQDPACTPGDRAALLGFKDRISKDMTGAMATWVGEDCCGGGWEGVECRDEGGGVNKLILQRPEIGGGDDAYIKGHQGTVVFMKGRLSPSLGSLQFLETLVISGMKRLNGPIPKSFENLTKLVHLVLDDNGLKGEIPWSLGRLKNLETFSVSGNHLGGQIPLFLGSLIHLQHLNLARNMFTGEIPESLSNLRELRHLDLSSNSLFGSIPDFLGEFHNLEYLMLTKNRFSGQIPSALCNLTKLSELSLDQNQLTGEIPQKIANLRSISVLRLSSNKLTGQIPESISQLHTLWNLNLSRNQLTNSVPDAALFEQGLSSILSIDLSYSGLSFGAIPSWITTRQLYEVHLAGCGLQGALPNFTQPGSLRSIDLSNNYFKTGISFFLQNMISLETAKISNNLLHSDVSSIKLPDQISFLDLHSNHLFGSLSGILSSDNRKLLEVFDLSQNQISGAIPEFSAGLNLKVLKLARNKISGHIPSSISNLDKLRKLDISRNKISGTIPTSLAKVVGLQWLDLSVNEINGKIPSSLLDIKGLRHANFRANKLCGEIPQGRPFNVFPEVAFAHNLCLCGKPLPPCKEESAKT